MRAAGVRLWTQRHCVCVCVCLCVCVCVCVWTQRNETQRHCVCVCVCVCAPRDTVCVCVNPETLCVCVCACVCVCVCVWCPMCLKNKKEIKNIWKVAKHCSSWVKCKSNLQWTTSHWPEWPSLKNIQTINAGEGVEKRKSSCVVGGNVNWYSHHGRWYGDFFKNYQ